MAYWNSEVGAIVTAKLKPWPDHPGWWDLDCGCCAGIEWGGETPRECRRCGGTGGIALHEQSGRLAQYPGGPFCGMASPSDMVAIAEQKQEAPNGTD